MVISLLHIYNLTHSPECKETRCSPFAYAAILSHILKYLVYLNFKNKLNTDLLKVLHKGKLKQET